MDEKGNLWADSKQPHPEVWIDVADESTAASGVEGERFVSDLLQTAAEAADKAKSATTMGEYRELRRELKELSALEHTVMGKQEKTQKFRDQTAAAMNATIARALAVKKKRVDMVRSEVGKAVQVASNW